MQETYYRNRNHDIRLTVTGYTMFGTSKNLQDPNGKKINSSMRHHHFIKHLIDNKGLMMTKDRVC